MPGLDIKPRSLAAKLSVSEVGHGCVRDPAKFPLVPDQANQGV